MGFLQGNTVEGNPEIRKSSLKTVVYPMIEVGFNNHPFGGWFPTSTIPGWGPQSIAVA